MKTPILFALLAAAALGQVPPLQNAVPLPTPKSQFLKPSGAPCVGCYVWTYAAGTTTPQATYTDSTAGTPNANPIVLDAGGMANIWIGGQAYKIVLEQPPFVGGHGTQVWAVDNVTDTTFFYLTYLRSISDSALLTYIGTGAGSVTRTVRARLGDTRNVKDFGAVCDGVTNDNAAFQLALDSFGASGGHLEVPAGKCVVSNLKWKFSSIVMTGAGPSEGPGPEVSWGTTLLPAAGTTGAVIELDPINLGASYMQIMGSSISNLTIDMANAPTATAIKIRSARNCPIFKDVMVFGSAGSALDIGISARPGALVSEGLVFQNFYVYALYAHPGTYSGSATAPAVNIVAANEISFRDGKIVYGKTETVQPLVKVLSDPTGTYPAYAITFDGVSTASGYYHYVVQGVGSVAPAWVRWENCTLENYNIAIDVNPNAIGFASKGLYVAKSTRFFATIGATPKKVRANYVQQSVFHHDYWDTASTIALGANAIWNEVRGPESNVTDLGFNAIYDVESTLGGAIIRPQLIVKSTLNPYVSTNMSGIIGKLQSLASSVFIGSESNHKVSFGVGNSSSFSILTGGNITVDNKTLSIYNNVSQSVPAVFEYNPTLNFLNLYQYLADSTAIKVSGVGAVSGNYINLFDTQIGGQLFGKAFLRWTRDSGEGRSFSIHATDNAGNTVKSLEAGYSGTVPMTTIYGYLKLDGLTFANLGAPPNGHMVYCSDCTVASPCAGGGTGAIAKRLNNAWICN